MPIDLPDVSDDVDRLKAPDPKVWVALLVAVMAASIAWTLLTWPEGKPTGTPWFWMRLLGYPALVWAAIFGFRVHFYEDEKHRLVAIAEVDKADREEAIAFGAEPLAVLGNAYLCAMGTDGVATSIAAKQTALAARTAGAGHAAVRHTRLDLDEGEEGVARYRRVFRALLAAIDGPLHEMPRGVPLEVYLQLPDPVDVTLARHFWEQAWAALGLPPRGASLVMSRLNMMSLDSWLDVPGGADLEKFVLVVAVALSETPAENSAEAGVALLLGWAPMAARHGLTPIARMHRPVAVKSGGVTEAIKHAGMFGRCGPDQLHHLWQSGLNSVEKVSLLTGAAQVGLGAAQTDGFAGVHDIDAALGSADFASPWLAVSLAVEQARQTTAPQLIVCREDVMELAVVQPMGRQPDTERS